MRWPDSTISGSFADTFIDDAQPHDATDGTHPILDSQEVGLINQTGTA